MLDCGAALNWMDKPKHIPKMSRAMECAEVDPEMGLSAELVLKIPCLGSLDDPEPVPLFQNIT